MTKRLFKGLSVIINFDNDLYLYYNNYIHDYIHYLNVYLIP